MFPRLFGDFFQHGYVTTDMAEAKAVFEKQYGVSQYLDIDKALEVQTPTGLKTLDLKISLVYVDTRKTTGHFSEYLWMAQDINAMVPRN